jgi:uncharacterized protein (DUF736 family)
MRAGFCCLGLAVFGGLVAGACASGPRPPVRNGRPSAALIVTHRVDHVDVLGREPMVIEHPNGSLFVAGYGEPRPTLWKSADGGATWSRLVVGSEADGAIGNSDVDLAVARDGTLYFVTMLFDREAGEGRLITIGVSRDIGASWRWTTLSKTRFDDRPWVEIAPDGNAHVIWNDGSGVSHAVTRDRGATWMEMDRIHDQGGSSHLAIGPSGELAVRIAPLSASGNKFHPGVDLIAVSSDAGASWHKRPAPGERDWSPELEAPGITPRWVEPLAWDPAGQLYSLWTDKTGVRLARSKDRGVSWTTWEVAPSDRQAFFPYLVATGSNQLAATWFSASNPDLHDLKWHVARIAVGAEDAPLSVVPSAPQTLESARRRPGQADVVYNDTAGEYLAIAALRDGTIGVVTPIQNKAANRLGFTWWKLQQR